MFVLKCTFNTKQNFLNNKKRKKKEKKPSICILIKSLPKLRPFDVKNTLEYLQNLSKALLAYDLVTVIEKDIKVWGIA